MVASALSPFGGTEVVRVSSEPAFDQKALTPSDTVPVPGGICYGLYVAAAGNITWVSGGGTTCGPYAVTAGQVLPFVVTLVKAATTATVLGLYHA